ncbi:MAG: LEA type 2 family protein [Oligoflexales bacterium]|nr:LEA type 2 family protein [Oligoflexales bacterium]
MFKNKIYSLIFMLLFLSGTFSCQFIKGVFGLTPEKPKIKLELVKLKKVSLVKVELEIQLKIENPNSFDLTISSMDYRLENDAKLLASGQNTIPIKLTSRSSTAVNLPLSLETQQALKVIQGYILNQMTSIAEIYVSAVVKTTVATFPIEYYDKKPFSELIKR